MTTSGDTTSTALRISALTTMLASVVVAVSLVAIAANTSSGEPSMWAEIGGAPTSVDRMATALARGWLVLMFGVLVSLVLLGVDLARTAGRRPLASVSQWPGSTGSNVAGPHRLAS